LVSEITDDLRKYIDKMLMCKGIDKFSAYFKIQKLVNGKIGE
jgi:hypothetical protein